MSAKQLKTVCPETDNERRQLVELTARLPVLKRLPHTASGELRLYRLIQDNYSLPLLAKLKELDAEYTFDEMQSLADIARFAAFTDRMEDKAKLLSEDYLDAIQLSAAYREYGEALLGKSRGEVTEILARTLALSNFYNVPEAEIARCAVSLSRFRGNGDMRHYLYEEYETTIKNAMQVKSVRPFHSKTLRRYVGARASDWAETAGDFSALQAATLRFFEENLSENFTIPAVVDLRAKEKAGFTTPAALAATGFYLVCAFDAGQIPAAQFSNFAKRWMGTLSRAEKWNGHLYGFLTLDTLKSAKIPYVPSFDAAMLNLALRLIKKVAVECSDAAAEEQAAKLLEEADLKVFLDVAKNRFRFGYFPVQARFDGGLYGEMYGNGLLLHLLTDTDGTDLSRVTENAFAGLVANLFYPVGRFLAPPAPKEDEAFVRRFLYDLFRRGGGKIKSKLYALANWGMSESGDLAGLSYRPYHQALILLSLNRDKIVRRLEKPLTFQFERPIYFPRTDKKTDAVTSRFSEGAELQKHSAERGDYRLECTSAGEIKTFFRGGEHTRPRLFLQNLPLSRAAKYRFTQSGAEYIYETDSFRVIVKISVAERGFAAWVKTVAKGAESAEIRLLLPEGEMRFYAEAEEKTVPLYPREEPFNRDFALKAVGANYREYRKILCISHCDFTAEWGTLAAIPRERLPMPAPPSTAFQAVLAPFTGEIDRPICFGRGKTRVGENLSGNFTAEFDSFLFEDFRYLIPAGKYLAGFTGLAAEDLEVIVFEEEARQVYSPFYYPLYGDGDYSVTLLERRVLYTAAFREIALELTADTLEGNFNVTVKIRNLTDRRKKLSVCIFPRNALARFSEGQDRRRDFLLQKYGEAEAAYCFLTTLNRSYNAPARFSVSGFGKEKDGFFNHMLMNAVKNLPRYLDCRGEALPDLTLAAFAKLLLMFDSALSRKLVFKLLARQSLEGNMPAPVVTYLLPHLVGEYIETTGDQAILNVEVGYSDSSVTDEVRYHLLKCLDAPAAETEEAMLTVFMLNSFLNCPPLTDNRYSIIKRRDAVKGQLARRKDFTEDEAGLYAILVEEDISAFFTGLAEKMTGVVCFGASDRMDAQIALYTDLLITRVFGLVKRGETLSFSPLAGAEMEKAVLRCELEGGKIILTYGEGGKGRVNVDGVDVSGDTRVHLPGKKRTMKVRVNV